MHLRPGEHGSAYCPVCLRTQVFFWLAGFRVWECERCRRMLRPAARVKP